MPVNGSVGDGGVDRTHDPVEDDVDDTDRSPPTRSNAVPKRRRRRRAMVATGIVAAGAVAVAAILLTSGSSKPKTNVTFTTFVDQKDGFTLSYPRSWTLNTSTDPTIVLKLSFGGGGLDVLQVRVVAIETLVDTSNVANIKSISDAELSGEPITLLQQGSTIVDRVPTYYYLYTLPPSEGVTLVHSHFFIFPPHQLVQILFQTVNQDFSPQANTFDQVIKSFKTSR